MKIVKTFPPNFEEVKKVFPKCEEQQAIFCYGDNIHNPFDSQITEDMKVHEAVHSRQQGKDPKGWWDRYVSDVVFRIQEEAEAYSAQLFYLKNTKFPKQDERGKTAEVYLPTRVTDWYLDKIAQTLSGPLYGEAITYHKAHTLVRKNMANFAL